MPTTGYTFFKPEIEIGDIIILESYPPKCKLPFHIRVYWEGHSLNTEVKRDGRTINIFVTLNVPTPGPMEGEQLRSSVDLGVLDPDIYDINFYLRRTGYEAKTHDYRHDATITLIAHDQADNELASTPHKKFVIENYKVWYNNMPGPSYPTLNLQVNIIGAKGFLISLAAAVPQGFNPNILMLKLLATKIATAPDEQEVNFSIFRKKNYSSITITQPNGDEQNIDLSNTIWPIYH